MLPGGGRLRTPPREAARGCPSPSRCELPRASRTGCACHLGSRSRFSCHCRPSAIRPDVPWSPVDGQGSRPRRSRPHRTRQPKWRQASPSGRRRVRRWRSTSSSGKVFGLRAASSGRFGGASRPAQCPGASGRRLQAAPMAAKWASILSASGSMPVKRRNAPTAWNTAMPPPSTVRHPVRRAARRSSVSSGT